MAKKESDLVTGIVIQKDGPEAQFLERIHQEGDEVARLNEALGRLRQDNYRLQGQNAKLEEQNILLGNRLKQLETILQSSFARAVAGLSAARKQFGKSQEAERIVAIVEDHYAAFQFLLSERFVSEQDAELKSPLLFAVRRLFHFKQVVVPSSSDQSVPEPTE